LQGYLVDKFGPRLLIAAGCLLSGAGWITSAYVTSLTGLYLTYGLFCGIGTGIVYIGIIGLMVRWFPDRRGFATGMVAAGYGFGAIATTFPISSMMASAGYQHTLVVFGIILGLVGAAAALAMRMPQATDKLPAVAVMSSAKDVMPAAMLKTKVFWLMFFMMTMMSTGGLMIISQFASFSRDFGVTKVLVFGLAALPLALTIDRITNGLTRPFFGWVSDQIGRENTMFIAFSIGAASLLTLSFYGSNPIVFVLITALFFGVFGEIYSLFPATAGDTFGAKFATTNNGMLYTAKGTASLLVPIASIVATDYGWSAVFAISVGANIIAALLALFVLKPMRRRLFARAVQGA